MQHMTLLRIQSEKRDCTLKTHTTQYKVIANFFYLKIL